MYKLSYLLFGFQFHQSFSVPKSCYFNESCQTPSSFAGGKSSSYTSILALSMQINTYGNSTNCYTSLRQRILPLVTKDRHRCRSALVSRSQTAFFRFSLGWRKKAVWLRETRSAQQAAPGNSPSLEVYIKYELGALDR